MSNKGIHPRLLTERGRGRNRYGDKYTHSKVEKWEGTFIPNRIYRYIFNDMDGDRHTWSALYRLVESKLGHRWNDVHSMVCSKATGGDYKSYYLRYALDRLVETDCVFYEGDDTPYDPTINKPLASGYIYVDLEGVLRQVPSRKYNYRKKIAKIVTIGENNFVYIPKGGIWIRDSYERKPPGWYFEGRYKNKILVRRLVLDKEGRPIWNNSSNCDDPKEIGKPKIDISIKQVIKYEYYMCHQTDLIKLRKGGYIK
ncbi:hypothetical protein H6G33_10290 [Calothrix sp. FACHB-1219]|uniref:hypothetical protein n=1 Tax=unclassified Calothrix TaxID=2619626 RepID=UPI0016821BDE|nr:MULTISPECIES: hypothetical protein [unclassified Calothrix]MBD2201735.1 hypothetical protein [Calothrix sp. FACHB-168]MBD2217421.1 hypothetical protein [Calothrix sp. FACHB-1219]